VWFELHSPAQDFDYNSALAVLHSSASKAAAMSPINVSNVVVLDNPSVFSNPLQFDITFDCYQDLEQDLTWTVTYVGCADDWRHDQVLEVLMPL
jgi:ASF1 like histone chaperone